MSTPDEAEHDGSDDEFVVAYLRRLGVEGKRPADLPRLRELHAAHLHHIPFENLSIHLGEPLSLEPAALAGKMLQHGRGGFCYELNGLFARLLECLGYRVTLLGARVWNGEAFGPPLDHLALVVGTVDDDDRWVADVGFGDHSLYPLRWEEGVEQHDPGGVFQLEPSEDGRCWDVYRDGVVKYRMEPQPRELPDFEAMCWYQQTSPRSHFITSVVCTRLDGDGRVTISGRRMITTTSDGKRETDLGDDANILATYRSVFGIELERVPRLPGRRQTRPMMGVSPTPPRTAR